MIFNSQNLKFANHFVDSLPGDEEPKNYVRQVYGSFYSFVEPTKVSKPSLLLWSKDLAAEFGIELNAENKEFWQQVLSGNQLAEGMQPYAMAYGGHQFGNWAGQLGDGRAINLGELVTDKGNICFQLKGAGVTPYSRHADGLAVLRSSIREYLCSEAMHALGVPTTRALSLALTGEMVERDMFYDGNAKLEAGAIVCRTSPSFIRFGSFELPSSRNELDNLKQLADFCIQEHFPELDGESPTLYLDWFKEVSKRTLELIVHWQRVGFVHGVMNTDNMSILGLTIDYGPYGWLEEFDPDWTPNTTDLPGRRYAYGNQAKVAQWNLYKLAEAIHPLVNDVESLQAVINGFPAMYQSAELQMQCEKLGLDSSVEENQKVALDLLPILMSFKLDFILFYRGLAYCDSVDELAGLLDFSYEDELSKQQLEFFNQWSTRLLACWEEQGETQARKQKMNQVNPWFALRNFLVQEAIEDAEKGDYAKLEVLQKALENPYEENSEFSHLVTMRPDWANNKAGCSMLSCSS